MEKNNNQQFDLTQGGILHKLLLVAVPIMGTQLMQMAYNLTDMFWLGRVSSDAVAASGTAGMYMWLSMGFMLIGRMGAEIGVSQNLGRGDRDNACSYAQTAVFLAAVLGVGYALVMVVFRYPLVGFFQIQEAHVAQDAVDYLLVVGGALPIAFVSGTIAGIFNGTGNSRAAFFINAAGLVVNMILDPLFILGLDMGITGAAVATAIGQLVVCLFFIFAIRYGKARPFEGFRFFVRPAGMRVRQIFRWSIPIGVENLLFTFLAMIISRFVALWGADAIAVQRVGSQVESLSWLIGGGFSSAITAFVGQNYGAGKWVRIHRGFRISLGTILAWGIIVTAILYWGGGFLFALFLPEPHIVEMGVSYLRILACCQLISCLEFAAAGAFRGIGRTLPPSLVSVSGNAIRVPVAYLLSTTSLGLDGIWWGVTLGAILRGLWIFVWYFVMARRLPREDLPVAAS